jgi:hypothetical protein
MIQKSDYQERTAETEKQQSFHQDLKRKIEEILEQLRRQLCKRQQLLSLTRLSSCSEKRSSLRVAY